MSVATRTSARPRRRRGLAIALAVGSLAGCTSVMQRYQALPETDRKAYEQCAMERCGPAPQWKGEASWALRQYEQERAAHVACWDRDLETYVGLPEPDRRRVWLAGRCRPLPSPLLLPVNPSARP